MFNTVTNNRPETNIEPFSHKIGQTSQYEGKDNAGGGYYRRSRKHAQEKKPSDKPNNNRNIDIVA